MIKFSIITCTWNSEPFIQHTIDSVKVQTYPNIEHIFVDGGSTDGTLERIQSLQGNVKWITDVRGGIANAMNEGVKIASGDVVAHLHSDDYYLTDTIIEEVVAEFDRTKACWLFGKIKSDIAGVLVEPKWLMPDYSYNKLLKGNFIAHPATFIKRKLFLEAGGFDTTLKYAMDYDLWLRLGCFSEPVYFDRWVAAFRRHAGSVSSSNPLAAMNEDYEVRKKYLYSNLIRRAYHHIHYLVRRRRVLKNLAHNTGSKT